MLTMVLGGLWHGAGWTFAAWGFLHGLYLVANHGWHALRPRLGLDPPRTSGWGRTAACALTFLAVVVGWVFFRAKSIDAALSVLAGMVGMHGFSFPASWETSLNWRAIGLLRWMGIHLDLRNAWMDVWVFAWISALLAIAWLLPNTQEFMRRYSPAIGGPPAEGRDGSWNLRWHPSLAWALVLCMALTLSLAQGDRISEFLYFQF